MSWLRRLFGTNDPADRKPQPDAGRDFVALLDEHAERGDALSIIQACNTLGGMGTTLFGISVREVSNPQALLPMARQALDVALTHVPLEQADAVITAAGRTSVAIELAGLRERLAAAAERARPTIEATLAQLTDIGALIEACETLAVGGDVGGTFFGSNWPHRNTLLDLARRRLVDTIAHLPPREARNAIVEVRRAELDIDLAAVSGVVSHVDTDEAVNADIEAAIDANPDDPASYAVLGDWLAERGHARGELIALQLRAETDPALAAAATAYVTEHAGELLGVLAELESPAPMWNRGFISEITLLANAEILLAEQVAALFAHPSGRRVRTLHLVPGNDDDDHIELDAAIAALADCGPEHLRHLVIVDTNLARYQPAELSPLWTGVPRLASLIVRGRFVTTPMHHAELVRVQFETVALSRTEAAHIAQASWPKLAHLDVWFGDQYDEEELAATIEDATSILARTDLPALQHLGLMNAAFTDEICAALASAPLATQLVELDLAFGTMSREGAQALIAAAPKLPNLEQLDVSGNYLDDATIAQLRRTFGTVIADEQRADDGERYPAIME